MTETIPYPVNIRKKRIMEAFKMEVGKNEPCKVSSATKDGNGTFPEMKPMQTSTYQEEIYNFLIKRKNFENWENVVVDLKSFDVNQLFLAITEEEYLTAELEKQKISANKKCHWKTQMLKNWEALQEDHEQTTSRSEESLSSQLTNSLISIEKDSLTIRASLQKIVKDWLELLDHPIKTLAFPESLIPKELEKSLHSLYIEMKTLDKKIKDLEDSELGKVANSENTTMPIREFQNLQQEVERLENLIKFRYFHMNAKQLKNSCKKELNQEPHRDTAKLITDAQAQAGKRQVRKPQLEISASSTHIFKKPKLQKPKFDVDFEADEDGMVTIGPNGTIVAKKVLESINWNLSGAAITRKILVEVFGRKTLASHSLTGKPSPAFIGCEKPMKNQLDPSKVTDIIHMVMQHTQMTAKEVRTAITTKCADENKMFRQRKEKLFKAASQLNQKKKD